jgi:hypothetical protein
MTPPRRATTWVLSSRVCSAPGGHRCNPRARLLPGLPRIVFGLHAQPAFRGRPREPSFQAQRHVGADAGFSMQQPAQGDSGEAQLLRRLGDDEAQLRQDVVPQDRTGMGG